MELAVTEEGEQAVVGSTEHGGCYEAGEDAACQAEREKGMVRDMVF